MPLFRVEWKWETEWTVEAATVEKAWDAAMCLGFNDVDPEGPDIWVCPIKPKVAKRIKEVHAVVVEGEMLHPDDARRRRISVACSDLMDDRDTFSCPQCDHNDHISLFAIRDRNDRVIGFDCPACRHCLDLDDLRCLVWDEYRALDHDARQGVLFDDD